MHMCSSIPSFLRNLHTVLCSDSYQFTFLTTMQQDSLISTFSPAFIVCRFFDDGHSDWCEVIPHCSFDLHFFNSDVEQLFMFYWPSVCLFGEMSL